MADAKDFEKLGDLNLENVDRAKEIYKDMERDYNYEKSYDDIVNERASKKHEEREKERDKAYEKEGEAKGAIAPFRWANHMIHAVMDPFEKVITDSLSKLPLIGPFVSLFIGGLFKIFHQAVGLAFRLLSVPFHLANYAWDRRSQKSATTKQYEKRKELEEAKEKIDEVEKKQKAAEKENEKAREAGGDNVFTDEKDGPLAADDAKNAEKNEPKLNQHTNLEDRTTIFKKGPKDVYGADQPQQPAMNQFKARAEKADNQLEAFQVDMKINPNKRPNQEMLNAIGARLAIKILDERMREDRFRNGDKPGLTEKRMRRANDQLEGSQAEINREITTLGTIVAEALKGKSNKEISGIIDDISSGKRTRATDDFRKEVSMKSKNAYEREQDSKTIGKKIGAPEVQKNARKRSSSLSNPSKDMHLPNM